MARVKDIESLRPPNTTTYKDKPDPHSSQHTIKSLYYQRKPLFYTLLTITLLFLIYQYHRYSSTSTSNPLDHRSVDWSHFAYSQYATDQHYLCNSLMVFASLQALSSKADRILFYPKSWDLDVADGNDRTSQLLVMARDTYHVKLRPVEMYTLKHSTSSDADTTNPNDINLSNENESEREKGTWDASINKLYAFSEGQYDRIIHLDSDITLLQNIDDLFFLPHGSTVAMPRAYWKDDHQLSSLLVVLEPSAHEADALWEMAAGNGENTGASSLVFDMDILNARYSSSALVLPHRGYALVTGEFRRPGRHNHTQYLGNEWETWDAHAALAQAKLVHFSDWPLPKPWIMWPNALLREMRPDCEFDGGTPDERSCDDRAVWRGLYDDFRRRRKEVCRLLSVPAPEWPPRTMQKPRVQG